VSEILYPQSDFPDMLFDPKMFAVIARSVIIMFVFCYQKSEVQAVVDFRTARIFVQFKFSTLTRLSYSEFGFPYAADEQTLRAL
jgi:hypothetical protein